jgi:hypothetical protein
VRISGSPVILTVANGEDSRSQSVSVAVGTLIKLRMTSAGPVSEWQAPTVTDPTILAVQSLPEADRIPDGLASDYVAVRGGRVELVAKVGRTAVTFDVTVT